MKGQRAALKDFKAGGGHHVQNFAIYFDPSTFIRTTRLELQ